MADISFITVPFITLYCGAEAFVRHERDQMLFPKVHFNSTNLIQCQAQIVLYQHFRQPTIVYPSFMLTRFRIQTAQLTVKINAILVRFNENVEKPFLTMFKKALDLSLNLGPHQCLVGSVLD